MSTSLTFTFDVDQTAAQAFAAINDVRAWWSAQIEGRTDELGAEFAYTVEGIHYSRFRITEMLPNQKVSWLVLESFLRFTEDKEEWTGTTVIFDVHEHDGRTRVTFTHEGLYPTYECYDVCSTAWGEYVNGSLRTLIESGAGRPDTFEDEEVHEKVQAQHTR